MPNEHKIILYIFHNGFSKRARLVQLATLTDFVGGAVSRGVSGIYKGHGLTLSGFGGLVGYHIDRPPFRASCGRFWGVGSREAVGLRVAHCVRLTGRLYPSVRRAKTGV